VPRIPRMVVGLDLVQTVKGRRDVSVMEQEHRLVLSVATAMILRHWASMSTVKRSKSWSLSRWRGHELSTIILFEIRENSIKEMIFGHSVTGARLEMWACAWSRLSRFSDWGHHENPWGKGSMRSGWS